MSDPTNPPGPGDMGGTPPPPPPPPPPPGGYAPPPPPPGAGYTAPGYGAAPPVAGGQLAEWWQRALAVILDGILLAVVGGIIGAILGFDDGFFDPGRRLLDLALGLAYFGLLNGGADGQTLGKKALNISVRDVATGGSIGEGRGLLRYFVSYVLGITCVLGLVDILFPLWDKQRQAIHDKAASSVVVKV